MKHNLLFLTLKVFSVTGGIEKVSRIAGKALHELCGDRGFSIDIYSAYDKDSDIDEKYFPASCFRGFRGRRDRFVFQSLRRGRTATVVMLSHINLLSVGYAIKKFSPGTRLVLLAHGIEVWQTLPAWKRRMLQACDLVLPVSHFTKAKMRSLHGLKEDSMRVINNCLDPFLPPLSCTQKCEGLLKRYGLTAENKVVLTLTRLSSKERYKGYDEVLMAVKALKSEMPAIKYLIVGKCDAEEKARLDRLIVQQGLQDQVILAGFVPDEELADHFNLADVYAMPSRKEGFGIVFIEALFYGKPVIAGNVDGSVDALSNGELGILINPDSSREIVEAIRRLLSSTAFLPNAAEVAGRFGYPVYKEALRQAMRSLFPPEQLPKEKEAAKQVLKIV